MVDHTPAPDTAMQLQHLGDLFAQFEATAGEERKALFQEIADQLTLQGTTAYPGSDTILD